MLVKLFGVLSAGSLIISGGILGYWVSQRQPPIGNLQSEVLTPRVKPGENLERRVQFIQRKNCAVYSERTLYDARSVRHVLDPLEFRAGLGPIGTHINYVVQIPIPVDTAFGPARLEIKTLYRCNPLHLIWPIYAPITTVNFEVVPL